MPWTLEITHVGLLGKGDATYISAANGGRRRGVLIDGGMKGEWRLVRDIIAADPAGLDVMVSTHYDADHLGGLTALLESGQAPYDAVRIYDQGESGQVVPKVSKRRKLDGGGGQTSQVDWQIYGREGPVESYVRAAKALPHVNRLTERVMATGGVPDSLAGFFYEPNTLVGREIMWDDEADLGTAPDPNGIPAGAPTLTCIAANQYVLLPGGGQQRRNAGVLGNAEREKNARSLAFLLEFGDFRYYVGGDLETYQEDAVRQYIVAQTANENKVQVFKTSHHGSANSSSNTFLTALDPAAAVISCGRNNTHGHPDQAVVDLLQARGIDYYVTGDDVHDGTTQLGNRARIAGGGGNAGTIIVSVTAAQASPAQNAPIQWDMHFWRPNAGYNINKAGGFQYAPAQIFTENFS